MTETLRAAAAAAPLQVCWTLASSPGLTLWRKATAAATRPMDTRTHTLPTLTTRSLTRTSARDPTMTFS